MSALSDARSMVGRRLRERSLDVARLPLWILPPRWLAWLIPGLASCRWHLSPSGHEPCLITYSITDMPLGSARSGETSWGIGPGLTQRIRSEGQHVVVLEREDYITVRGTLPLQALRHLRSAVELALADWTPFKPGELFFAAGIVGTSPTSALVEARYVPKERLEQRMSQGAPDWFDASCICFGTPEWQCRGSARRHLQSARSRIVDAGLLCVFIASLAILIAADLTTQRREIDRLNSELRSAIATYKRLAPALEDVSLLESLAATIGNGSAIEDGLSVLFVLSDASPDMQVRSIAVSDSAVRVELMNENAGRLAEGTLGAFTVKQTGPTSFELTRAKP